MVLRIIFMCVGILFCLSCNRILNSDEKVSDKKMSMSKTTSNQVGEMKNAEAELSRDEEIELFGVMTKRDDLSIMYNLSKAGVLKVDSISENDGKLKFAIVEFAGVKFGVNPGLTFVTSRNDMTAVNSIVDEIDKYYKSGHSEDGDSDDPLNIYYSWGGILEPEKPWIRLRSVHSSDGGLTMIISL